MQPRRESYGKVLCVKCRAQRAAYHRARRHGTRRPKRALCAACRKVVADRWGVRAYNTAYMKRWRARRKVA